MSTARRAVTFVLLLPLAGLLACQEGPTDSVTEERVKPAVVDPNPGGPGQGQGPPDGFIPENEVPLKLGPANTGALEDAADEGDWQAFWDALAWEVSDDFSGEVQIWAVIVKDREARLSFLSDPVDPTVTYGPGDEDAIPNAPDGDDWVPGNRWVPDEENWVPGNMWVPGNRWLPDASAGAGEPLPAVAAFFRSDAWVPGNMWSADPSHWVVNGIIDGIFQEAPGAGVNADVGAKMLIQPVAMPDEHGPHRSGQPATGGILVTHPDVQ